jgi:hypothetical protein
LIELKGRQDGSTKQIERPLSQVSSREGICEISGEPLLPNTICSISFESPYVNRTLRSIGIPVFDIVKIVSPTETYFIELTKDKSKIESWGSRSWTLSSANSNNSLLRPVCVPIEMANWSLPLSATLRQMSCRFLSTSM